VSPVPTLRGTTVGEAVHSAQTAIAAAGADSPRLDAELLLAGVLDVTREQLVLDRDAELPARAVRDFQDVVRRRAFEREPVAYIVGRRSFRQLELAVDRRALIPRPETELLVDVGLMLPHGARVLDVGTGSGAVALALKHERPDLLVAASDVSADAIALARENGARLGLEVHWWQGDLLENIDEPPDAILSNPPYVSASQRGRLAPEILRHEPAQALFAPRDGFAVVESLLAQAAARRVSLVAVEVGAGQAARVRAHALALGFAGVRCERDLAGIERVVVAEHQRGSC
jgi:release factor glutamine methyltransferase